jgi:hypothetical protein
MTTATEKRTAPAGDESVRMYPANQLKEQLREPKETFSAFKVLQETFFLEK